MNDKYLYSEPLNKCAKILGDTDGITYILLCADIDEDGAKGCPGGTVWSAENSHTSFFSMVGTIIETYFEKANLSYPERRKIIKVFNANLIRNTLKNKRKED